MGGGGPGSVFADPVFEGTVALLDEPQLAYLFGGLLAAGSVVLLFVPIIRRAWTYAASPLGFALVVGPMLALGVGAIALVVLAISNPLFLIPVVAVAAGLRVGSPVFLYRLLRGWFEERRGWAALRLLVLAGFVGLVGYLVYDLVRFPGVPPTAGVVVLSAQFVMAVGASGAIVSLALRAKPKELRSMWPLWLSAILFATAFIVVAPYAFPAFVPVYAIAGIAGGVFGAVALWYDW